MQVLCLGDRPLPASDESFSLDAEDVDLDVAFALESISHCDATSGTTLPAAERRVDVRACKRRATRCFWGTSKSGRDSGWRLP